MAASIRRQVGAAPLLFAIACSGSATAPPDAGAPDAGFAPTAAALPVLTPCPPGWREVPDEAAGVTVCDPWPAGGEPTCAADEVALPGEPGCVGIGDPCPAGDFPEDLPAGRPIIYVLAGAPPGGTGTQASPIDTIGAALTGAPAGAIIAIAKGSYDEAVTPPAGTTLWGACAAETVIASSLPASAGTITVTMPGVVARNLTLGGARPAVWVAGGDLLLDGVLLAGARGYGALVVGGARLDARNSVIRDTALDLDGTAGTGLLAFSGATVDLERVAVEGSRTEGIVAQGAGTQLSARALVVRDTFTVLNNGLWWGHGLVVSDGAVADIAQSTFDRNYRIAVGAWHAALTVEDSVVHATRGDPRIVQTAKGWCMLSLDSQLIARRVLCDDNQARGLVVGQLGTGEFTDVVVRDTLPPGSVDSAEGAGMQVDLEGSVVLERVLFARNTRVSLGFWTGYGTLRDVTIMDTLLGHDMDLGIGLVVAIGSVVTGERVCILRSRSQAIQVSGGARLELSEAKVNRVVPTPECAPTCPSGATLAIALAVLDDASVELTHFVLGASDLVGVQLARGGVADLHDGEVSHHPIGVNVQTEGFDVSRLQDGVLFLENDINLDSASLTVPDPVPIVDPG